jgi:hypothetical protein
MRTPQESRALAADIRSKSAKQYLDKAAKEKKQGVNMNEDFAAIGDVITLVANEQPGEATTIINDLLGARIADALQSHKQDIAKSLFAPSADALSEEIVQEEHESVEDFKKRGGKVKQIPAHKSYSAPKSQKIKVPFRMGKKAMREEAEQLVETPTRKQFQQVADIIKAHPDAKKRQELANHHAAIFALQNPRFSHEKFHAAVGTTYK